MMVDLSDLTLAEFIDAVAARLADRLWQRDDNTRIDQRDPRGLRDRRHIEAVRRRIAEQAGGAWIVGRDYLLSPAAVREELARYGGQDSAPTAAPRLRKTRQAGKAASVRDEAARVKRELETAMRASRGKI